MKTVLHLEDSDGDAEIVSQLLKKLAPDLKIYRVKTIADAKLALEQKEICLALIDLYLTLDDGLEVVFHIKTNARFTNIPVVVTSGSERFTDVLAARAVRCDYYFVKPWGLEEMTRVLTKMLKECAVI